MTAVKEEVQRVSTTVPLDWNEVWFTNCPMVSANNVDQELGWCREEFKKIGLTRSLNTIKNDWWRIQEDSGIRLMLRLNGMTLDEVEIGLEALANKHGWQALLDTVARKTKRE